MREILYHSDFFQYSNPQILERYVYLYDFAKSNFAFILVNIVRKYLNSSKVGMLTPIMGK